MSAEIPDRDALMARVTHHLAGATGREVRVDGLRPLIGGACQDNLLVELHLDGAPHRLVLRSDARGSLPGSLDRATEYRVIEAAVAAGVRTPAARWLGRDLVRPGASAYFLEWVPGVALGARVLQDPGLASARSRLPGELAEVLAAIHRVRPSFELPAPSARDGDPVASALAFQRATLDRLPEPRPALELALRWLREHPPASREVTLVHGDFRTGNFMVTPEGLAAVLDWEFAHWGHPMEDLAWLCVRDWRFGALNRPAGGLTSRATFYAAYAATSGREVNPAEVHFFEILGNLRWAAGAIVQSLRYHEGGEPDLELLAIGQRAREMELEALRLIELGPPAG